MPFSWYHPDLPKNKVELSDKTHKIHVREIMERTALLMRMGYTREDARRRLLGNVKWDFELNDKPAHLDLVSQLVDDVYEKRGFGAGGTPSLE